MGRARARSREAAAVERMIARPERTVAVRFPVDTTIRRAVAYHYGKAAVTDAEVRSWAEHLIESTLQDLVSDLEGADDDASPKEG